MSSENKAIVRRIMEDFNKGELDSVVELSAPELVNHSSPQGLPPTREGWRRALGPHLAGALVVVVLHPVVDAGINVLASAALGQVQQFERIFVHIQA